MNGVMKAAFQGVQNLGSKLLESRMISVEMLGTGLFVLFTLSLRESLYD